VTAASASPFSVDNQKASAHRSQSLPHYSRVHAYGGHSRTCAAAWNTEWLGTNGVSFSPGTPGNPGARSSLHNALPEKSVAFHAVRCKVSIMGHSTNVTVTIPSAG